MRARKIATIAGLAASAVLTIIYTPLGYSIIGGSGAWARYFEIARQTWPVGDVVLLMLLVLLVTVMFKRKEVGKQLEILLAEPPLLDLRYILESIYTIARNPRRNIGEFMCRVRLHHTTPLSTRHVSGDRRLSLRQFVCVLTNTAEDIEQGSQVDSSISRLRGVCLHNMVRRLKPKVVVETGIAGGHMSWYMLRALNENNRGILVSIDLPDYRPEYYREPENSPAGYMVPKELRSRWELILEDSRTALPRVSVEHEIDMFVHDSLHTCDHMTFEFETVWPHLVPGGVLLAHDADKAFVDFAQRVGRPYWIWERYGGIVK